MTAKAAVVEAAPPNTHPPLIPKGQGIPALALVLALLGGAMMGGASFALALALVLPP